MKVLLLTSSYPAFDNDPHAAAGHFVEAVAKEMARNGHEVHVLFPAARKSFQTAAGIQLHIITTFGEFVPLSTLRLWHPIDFIKMILLLLKGAILALVISYQFQIERIIAFWVVPSGLWAVLSSRILKVPYVTWALGSDIWVYGRRPILKNIVSYVMKKSVANFADGFLLRDEAIQLSHKPVEFLPSARTMPSSTYTGERDPHRFLFVGRYHVNKGPDVLIEAMVYVNKVNPKIRLIMFGLGALKEQLQNKISDYGLSANITLGDGITAHELANELRQAHCLVVPSRIESIPCVLSDAMQMNCPVIVTDVGDMGTLVREFQCGGVVKPEDPLALANEILKMAEASTDIFSAGIAKMANKFNIKTSALRLLG